MNRLLALAVLLATASAHSADDSASQAFDVKLVPGEIHEECRRIEVGGKRSWHWKADRAVDFNIHHHRDAEVFYPVKREGMRGDGGTFVAKTAEDYCWMWSARPGTPVRVQGAIGR
jgi:hypothetical protein